MESEELLEGAGEFLRALEKQELSITAHLNIPSPPLSRAVKCNSGTKPAQKAAVRPRRVSVVYLQRFSFFLIYFSGVRMT